MDDKLNLVTGAFSYTGKYITELLLRMGEKVQTLTGHPHRNPFKKRIIVFPYNFDDLDKLKKTLEGVNTLYNTYWIHFSYHKSTIDKAVENTKKLVLAAKEAGVKRIVHISVSNPRETSPLPYFRGKARAEEFIINSELSYAIIRPTIIFGLENIPLNNIAYFLRKFPLFAVFGSGKYLIRPIFVGDVAEIAVKLGHREENIIVDIAGPEVFTYDQLVHLIARSINSRAKIIHLPPEITLFIGKILGYILKDVTINRNEMRGLMSNLYISKHPLIGKTCISQWLKQNAEKIGTRYISELKRYYFPWIKLNASSTASSGDSAT
ncbi:MAG: NAD(P)H-binding protein [Deltaproteobacteria bacterium]|nr:NAD(P)H-binding protein [Deltaproteobacteria bacterium]